MARMHTHSNGVHIYPKQQHNMATSNIFRPSIPLTTFPHHPSLNCMYEVCVPISNVRWLEYSLYPFIQYEQQNI